MVNQSLSDLRGLMLSGGPKVPPPVLSENNRIAAKGLLAGVRVLVVEDSLLVALDLVRALQECHAELLGPVSRVQEALALIASAPPDAAVLDVNLLDGSVAPVADRLQERGIPFVLLTGFELPTEMKQRHSAICLYTKPANPIEMAEKLAELLGQ